MKIVKCKTLEDYQACGPTSFFVDNGDLFLKNFECQWLSGEDENHWFSDSLLADTIERDVFVEDPDSNVIGNPNYVMFELARKILLSDEDESTPKRFAREIVTRKYQVIKLQAVIRALDPTGERVEKLEKSGVLGAHDMETPA